MDSAALKAALLVLVKPIVLEVYQQVLLPELQKLESQVSAPALKVVSDALLEAIEKIVPAEIDKIP